jgi:phospholipid/cholesterol/gamma-HCH transport system permease protein
MPRASTAPSSLTVAIGEARDRAALEGTLDIRSLTAAERALAPWLKGRYSRGLDLSHLAGLDTPGALFLCGLRARGVELTGIRDEHRALLDLICGLELKPLPKSERVARWRQLVTQLGKGAAAARHETLDVIAFVGEAANAIGHALAHPRSLRLSSISRHISETGIRALPIIGLMAVMIAIVIGYQGVAQLRPYGGEVHINLVAVSVLREMGVLITAIMVAGRCSPLPPRSA